MSLKTPSFLFAPCPNPIEGSQISPFTASFCKKHLPIRALNVVAFSTASFHTFFSTPLLKCVIAHKCEESDRRGWFFSLPSPGSYPKYAGLTPVVATAVGRQLFICLPPFSVSKVTRAIDRSRQKYSHMRGKRKETPQFPARVFPLSQAPTSPCKRGGRVKTLSPTSFPLYEFRHTARRASPRSRDPPFCQPRQTLTNLLLSLSPKSRPKCLQGSPPPPFLPSPLFSPEATEEERQRKRRLLRSTSPPLQTRIRKWERVYVSPPPPVGPPFSLPSAPIISRGSPEN